MKLFVPACGDRIILTKPWKFPLTLERRNIKFAIERGLLDPKFAKSYGVWESEMAARVGGTINYGKYKTVDAFLSKETILECDRMCIRARTKSSIETDDYVCQVIEVDSITWRVISPKTGKMILRQRFWVKLADCLQIEYKINSTYRDR